MEAIWVEPGHAVGVVGATLVQIWETAGPDAARMQRILELLRQRRATLSASYSIAVVSVASPMPDAEARKVAAAFPEYFDFYVGVHEGTSFRAAMVRAVLVGMAMLGRVRARYEVCSTVEEGVRELATQSRGAVLETELLRGIDELRAQSRAAHA